MVLCAGMSTVLAFFIAARLYPGKRTVIPSKRVTDDQFVVMIEQSDAAFDPRQVGELLQRHGVVRVEEQVRSSEELSR